MTVNKTDADYKFTFWFEAIGVLVRISYDWAAK